MDTINILAKVYEGMTVNDHNGESIGKVNYVQMTDDLVQQPGPETTGETAAPNIYADTLVGDIADVFNGNDDLPEEVREKLLREGFIRIDIGFLRSDRFAVPEQIASVSGEEVYLNVSADDLIAHS